MTPAAAAGQARWQEAVLERIESRTPRVKSFFLQAVLPAHEAGQHVDVRLTAPDGYQAERSYSIASAPGAASLELAIERLEEGEVSPFFHDVAAAGDKIELRGPIGGHFVWRAEDGGPVLLLAGGSGVVPLMAIVRHRAAVAPEVPALMLYSARRWEELVFRDELQAAEAPMFAFFATTTRGPRQRPQDFDRRVDGVMLREILVRWGRSARQVYVCGSNAFVEAASSGLVREGVAPAIIRTERFGGPG